MRSGDMVQPWFRANDEFKDLGKVSLEYTFEIEEDLLDQLPPMTLALETPEQFDIKINGNNLESTHNGDFWCDIAFKKIDLPSHVFQQGTNTLHITTIFRENLNLEPMYLLGNFSVFLEGLTPRLRALPDKVNPCDLVKQGFPYYSGSFTYLYPTPKDIIGQKVMVRVPAYEGAFARVTSGNHSKLIPWRPNECIIEAEDELMIEISITRKNTFGPLHIKDPRPKGVYPGLYVVEDERSSPEPVFIESGLLEPITCTIVEK